MRAITLYINFKGGVRIKKQRKRLWYILLIIFVAIVIIISALAIYQKNNIQALLYASKYNGDELAEKNQDVDSQIKAIVDQMSDIHVRALTEEERQKLSSGEVSREEALMIITGGSMAGDADNSNVNDLVAEFYLLKAEYLNLIDGLLEQGKSEWTAIPEKERTLTTKLTLAEKYMAKGEQLETECDQKMNTLLKKLETELKASGFNTAIISQITTLYNEEKAVKKAALLEKYYPK